LDLMEAGESFDEIEDAICEIRDLNGEQKAALWLVAFSQRGRSEQRQAAQGVLALAAGRG
jgi:hypothetical protein